MKLEIKIEINNAMKILNSMNVHFKNFNRCHNYIYHHAALNYIGTIYYLLKLKSLIWEYK